jgi:hypothetical protein
VWTAPALHLTDARTRVASRALQVPRGAQCLCAAAGPGNAWSVQMGPAPVLTSEPAAYARRAGKVLARLATLCDLEVLLGELVRLHPRFTLVGTTVPLHLLAARHGVAPPPTPAKRARKGTQAAAADDAVRRGRCPPDCSRGRSGSFGVGPCRRRRDLAVRPQRPRALPTLPLLWRLGTPFPTHPRREPLCSVVLTCAAQRCTAADAGTCAPLLARAGCTPRRPRPLALYAARWLTRGGVA